MNSIHGIIACSGDATRFAQSVGKPPPYPKHLEMIGERSVLGRALDSLVTNIGVSSITFALNPQLKDRYLAHLVELQSGYPDIPFSYTVSEKTEGQGVCEGLRKDIKQGLYDLNGQRLHFADPIVALAFGDTIVKIRDHATMQEELQGQEEKLQRGQTVRVVDIKNWSGTLYLLGKLDYLSDKKHPDFEIEAYLYGLQAWNINRKKRLTEAKKGLGYPFAEDEISLISPERGKESR